MVARISRLALLVLAATSIASLVAAQTRTADPAKRGVPLTAFPRVVPLAENVYGYEAIRQPGFTTVSLFVVGANGVLVADGQGSPADTKAMLDAIAKVTPKPVKWYVMGSDHGDHTAGNSVLPKDIQFIVHRNSRAQLERDATAAATPSASGAARPPVVVPPTAMAGDQERVDIGGIQVDVRFLGRAHTGGDLMVYLPQSRILFMSEAYLNRVFPAMRSAYPTEWIAVIDKALAMDVQRYVPGHGFIEEAAVSREELVTFQQALKDVIAEARRLHALKLPADAALAQANWGPYAEWFLADQQAAIALRRVYDELDGRLK